MFPELRQHAVFENFSDDELACFTTPGTQLTLGEGEALFYEGDPPRGLFILLEGELEITKVINGKNVILATHQEGSFVGEISLLTGNPHTATARTTKPSRLLRFAKDQFAEQTSPMVNLMLQAMALRLRNTEARVQQDEKLAALGKLSAGLAHELNNPASANLRAAEQLPEHVFTLQNTMIALNRLAFTPEQMDELYAFQSRLVERAANAPKLNPIEQSDRESALETWLEDQGVREGWRFAPVLVGAGVTTEELDALVGRIQGRGLEHVLAWFESTLTIVDLLTTLRQSATRIVDLIQSVKAYSYMDQSPRQEVNIHDGIEDTLKILAHKLKGVTIIRDYAPDLPRLTVYGSELNQVWTNIIDNAIDAMQGKGTLKIRTWEELDHVLVEITDDGPGISEAIQSRIFEPFFTTKGVGEGTGLGLDIVYRIVSQTHKGSVDVHSVPGETRFTISLPIHTAGGS